MHSLVLLRTDRLGEREADFGRQISRETNLGIVILADETKNSIATGMFPKISLTRQRSAELDLYCPADFTWRCGDYGLYLARISFPNVTHFWLIEPDVRSTFSTLGDVLSIFDKQEEVDLLAAGLMPAQPDWFWFNSMRCKAKNVYRCLFPFARVSARALDVCLRERQQDRKSMVRRLMWPNDEAFVATEVINAGLIARDLNSFDKEIYTNTSFSFHEPFDADDPNWSGQQSLIFHPVLYGDDFKRKKTSLARPQRLADRARQRILRLLHA